MTLFSECGIYPADVVFVLDSSGSVSRSDFAIQLNFVTSFMNALEVSSATTSTHFAVISYGSAVRRGIELNQYMNNQDLVNAVQILE